ncbi:stage II sporulation protein M [archaeon]|nr:MAG: stage II sporulation protein M [archaeon]
MVLERLESVRDAVRNPWHMLLVGGIISVISLFIAFMMSAQSVGMFTSFIVTIAMMPLMVNLITYEEVKEEQMARMMKGNILQRHGDILWIYSSFFTGMLIALTLIFMMLPADVTQKLFGDQINQINVIRGNATVFTTFEKVIVNNIGVLLVAFIFSLLFGAGAVFILTWNASILATAIGMSAKSLGGVAGLPLAVLTYLPHGSLEILAYFIGGISGGLLSAAITRRKSKWFGLILRDSLKLLSTGVVILFIAAIIESVLISVA